MDPVLFVRQAAHFQSMELERAEPICGFESSSRSRLWGTRGDCAGSQEVAVFGLELSRDKPETIQNGLVGNESLGSGSEVITEPIFPVEGVDGSGLLSPFRRRDTRGR